MKKQEPRDLDRIKQRRFPKSIRKHLREEKARIRRNESNTKKQTELIKLLYSKFGKIRIVNITQLESDFL